MTYNYSKITKNKDAGSKFYFGKYPQDPIFTTNNRSLSIYVYNYALSNNVPNIANGERGCHNDNFTLSITKCVIVKFKILLNFLSDIFDQYYFIQYNWHGHAKKMVYRYWKPWPNDLSDLLNYKQYLKNPAEAITHRSKCH